MIFFIITFFPGLTLVFFTGPMISFVLGKSFCLKH